MPRNIWTQKEYLLEFNMLNTLESLFNLARERKKVPVEGSYTNKLLNDKSLSKEKVLEEIVSEVDQENRGSIKYNEKWETKGNLLVSKSPLPRCIIAECPEIVTLAKIPPVDISEI